MRSFIYSLLIATILTFPAFAAKPKPAVKTEDSILATDPGSVPVLQKIKGNNKDLSYDYLGQRFGMDAWLLSGPNVMQIVYTSKNIQGALIGGALVGNDGKEISSDLTKEFMKQYPERAQEILVTVRKANQNSKDDKKSSSSSEMLWQKLQQSGNITFGDNKDASEIYAFLDPAAPMTKDVWTHLSPIAKDNKIILHIVPLALTTADSIMDIATILGDKDPKTAWANLMNGQLPVKQAAPDSSGVLAMKSNVDIAQSLKLRDLPFFVYRDKSGKIRVLQGIPKDWGIISGQTDDK